MDANIPRISLLLGKKVYLCLDMYIEDVQCEKKKY